MTSRSGQTWFVPRRYRGNPPRVKGIVPVSRAGYMAFAVFVACELLAMALGMWIMFAMPDRIALGIAVIVIGVGLSMAYLFINVARHTDYTLTIAEFRARQAGNA